MSIQASIGLIYLSLVIIISVVFLFVLKGSKLKIESEKLTRRFFRIQIGWILALLAAAAIFTLATISLIHYPGVAAPLSEERQIVKIEGLQYGWVMEPKQIKAGIPVEFQATSRDVNHGLGIADANGVLLFQVQAMPKYVNRAVYTFEKPGTYRIICLEYCGVAHHVMIREFEVIL